MIGAQTLRPRELVTALIYFSAALADSWLWFDRNTSAVGLVWFAALLLYAFSYPRILFPGSTALQTKNLRAAVLHGLGVVVTTVFFSVLATPFWGNPLRDLHSGASVLVCVLVSAAFIVVALMLLVTERSTSAVFASFLFWPYALLLALVSVDRFFQEPPLRASMCFLCLVASILFALSAGTIPRRPAVAHLTALFGLVAVPWLYWTLRDNFGNVWLTFNIADKRFGGMYSPWGAALTISSVAVIALAIITAGLRTLPTHWQFRKRPLRERTWPAVAGSSLFLIIWFSQSVMPYRIPGMITRGVGGAMLQILHVEKRGLQFHETYVSVGGYPRNALLVYFSNTDRRLFQYRFSIKYSSGQPLPESLNQRVRTLLRPSERGRGPYDRVTPLRAWNADGWYVNGEGIGLRVYRLDKGAVPPQQIVDLFNDLLELPRSRAGQSEVRDVCLGFCYDPLSAMGWVFANERCQILGRNIVCR